MKAINFVVRKSVAVLLVSGFLVMASVPALARTKKQTATPALSVQPSVEFINSDNGSSTFNIFFESPKAVKFELVIRDNNGDVLYSNEFEAAKFNKFVKFVHSEGEDVLASFTIRETVTGAEQTFEAGSTTKLVKNVTVIKL